MKTAIDTNILFDILLDNPAFADLSQHALTNALRQGSIVVCPVVYAELGAHMDDPARLDAFLDDLGLRLDPFQPAALWATARAWRAYTAERGRDVRCNWCSNTFGVSCPSCGGTVAWRQHLIPDFLIGGHALHQADSLLTRDRGYYTRYFPELRLRTP